MNTFLNLQQEFSGINNYELKRQIFNLKALPLMFRIYLRGLREQRNATQLKSIFPQEAKRLIKSGKPLFKELYYGIAL